MLQQDSPEDYVIATGVAHSVRDCLEIAFDQAGIEPDHHVVIDESLKRPAEVDHLIGDAIEGQARARLGAADELRGADPADGGRRLRAAQRRRPAGARAARPARSEAEPSCSSALGVASHSEARRALVTGLTGQDGSFLAELLLDRGYLVTGSFGRAGADGWAFRAPAGADRACRRRPARPGRSGRGRRGPARRALPPRGAVVHARLLGAAGQTLAAIAGATATLLEAVRTTARQTSVFVAGVGRDVRRRTREPPARGHAVPAADALRDGEARRAPARWRATRT